MFQICIVSDARGGGCRDVTVRGVIMVYVSLRKTFGNAAIKLSAAFFPSVMGARDLGDFYHAIVNIGAPYRAYAKISASYSPSYPQRDRPVT